MILHSFLIVVRRSAISINHMYLYIHVNYILTVSIYPYYLNIDRIYIITCINPYYMYISIVFIIIVIILVIILVIYTHDIHTQLCFCFWLAISDKYLELLFLIALVISLIFLIALITHLLIMILWIILIATNCRLFCDNSMYLD